MKNVNNVLVVCIDRDDDLGRKTSAKGPIIGRRDNLNCAAKLALADPEDSDANCMFAAVKKYDEIKGQFANVEVATLTGHPSRGFAADKAINEQLDIVAEKFAFDSFILVTDGSDDDQLIPLLQSRAPIISKEQIIIKQAYEVESTFYKIKEILKDPYVAGVIFGIPGIVLVLYATMYYLGYEKFFFQAIAFILGIYLILKGTGLEDLIAKAIRSVTKPISAFRTSSPFYIAVIFIFTFGLFSAYGKYILTSPDTDILSAAMEALVQFGAFGVLASITFVLGKCIDAIHFKRAYLLGRYFLVAVFIIIVWFLVVSAKEVIVGNMDTNLFLLSMFASFVIVALTYKVAAVFDVRKKTTKLLIGLPVYSNDGRWLGKVEEIDATKKQIFFTDVRLKKKVEAKEGSFLVKDGKIVLQ